MAFQKRSQERRRVPRKERPRLRVLTPATQVTRLVRSSHLGALSRAAADSGWGFSWTIGDLPNYTEISNLFRRFRIDLLEVTFTMTAVAVSATLVRYPVIYLAVDYSDASAPGSLSSIQERKHTVLAFSQAKTKFVIRLRPRLTDTAGAILPQSMFTSSTSDTYYGIKFWIEDYNSTSADGRISMVETYHLSVQDEH